MYASFRSSRLFGLALILCTLLALSFISHKAPKPSFPKWLKGDRPRPTPEQLSYEPPTDLHSYEVDPFCAAFPDPGNIAIAVKTGATEAVSKIPILMMTALRCAQNVMIFSDLEQDVAGYHLHDSLKSIPKSSMEGNSDFDFYWRLKEAERYGEVELMLKDAKDPRSDSDLAAWTLDKYKQLHILEELHASYPDKDWYMMIDADTYIVWSNLLEWIWQLPDPTSHKLYLGSDAYLNNFPFGHGGSGILLSQATMHELFVANQGVAASWDTKMYDECCGDYVIALALKETCNVKLKKAWPTINGEKPSTMPFGPSHWCQPAVTFHHITPSEVNILANFELERNETQNPLTFADLYHALVKDILPESLDDWDNYPSGDKVEVDSWEACEEACRKEGWCFQFTHHGGECSLGDSIHLGEPKSPEGDVKWRSGWLRDRIKDWVDKQEPCRPKFPNTGYSVF